MHVLASGAFLWLKMAIPLNLRVLALRSVLWWNPLFEVFYTRWNFAF